MAQLVEGAARRYGLLGFISQKGEFERGGFVLRIDIESLFKLIARFGIVAGLEERVSEVL